MKLSRFTETDYPMLVEWWTAHKHPIIPFNMLSPFGLVSFSDKSEPAAMSFIYLPQGCDAAQISWTTTNPQVSPRVRYEAVDYVVKGLISLAKKGGRSNVMCFSDSSGLNKIYAKQGLKELKDHKLMYTKLGAL